MIIISGQSSSNISEQKKLNHLFEKAESISNKNPVESNKICFSIYKNKSIVSYPELFLKCIKIIAYNYYKLDENKLALSYAEKYQSIAKEQEDNFEYFGALRLKGIVYAKLGIYKESEEMFQEALMAADKITNSNSKALAKGSVYANMASIAKTDSLKLKYTKSALIEHGKIKNSDSQKNIWLAIDYSNIGDYFIQRKVYDSATYYLNKSLPLAKDDKMQLAVTNFNLGLVKENLNNHQEALPYLLNAEKENPNNLGLSIEIYKSLINCYKVLGKTDLSRAYEKKYSLAKAKLDNGNKESVEIAVNQIVDKKESSFFAEKRNLVFVISAIALLLIISIGFGIKNHKKSKKEFVNYQKIIEKLQNQESLISLPVLTTSTSEKTTFAVSSDKETEILKKLEKFEKSEGFKNKNLSLSFLAESLATNTAYLSTVINANKNKNFNSYINELRINYIIHKLKNDPQYSKYKISHLAEECGFSSHNTFTTVFSNLTGVSPSNFVKFLTQENT